MFEMQAKAIFETLEIKEKNGVELILTLLESAYERGRNDKAQEIRDVIGVETDG